MGFGIRLKEILKQKGMTIKELSIKTGIPLNTLYSITKRDTLIPSQEIISKISQVLQVNENEFLTYEVIKDNLGLLLSDCKSKEDDFRKKLYEISEMLNADALYELIEKAIELLQDDSCRSIFYKNDKIK